MVRYDPVRSGILEMLGCFALMFFGSFTTKIPKDVELQNSFLLENAIANLFIYMVMMWLAAQHSGSQFNPLISIAIMVAGELPFTIAIVNIIAQAAGAFLGFLVLQILGAYEDPYFNYSNVGTFGAIFLEFLPSFTLTLVFLMTFCYKTADRGVYAFSVPAVYAMFTISIGKIFYTRYNILLFFVNSMLTFEFESNFLFVIAGGVAGAAMAAVTYVSIFKNEARKDQLMPMADDDHQIKF